MPRRSEILQGLKDLKQPLDILVIGGGATGCGCALDAASRGLKVGLVERGDFSQGTSSRSTKLIHGGVRYLEQAVKNLDKGQYHLVREALKERALLIKLAPHLCHPLPIFTPLYKFWEKPYYRLGLKLYDWVAGKVNLAPSRSVSRQEALKEFSLLNHQKLKGGVLYYDGQFDDARMNLSLALTAAQHGALIANYLEVVSLSKDNQKLSGVMARDTLSGDCFSIQAKCVINAAGPFADELRFQDDPQAKPMLTVSSGAHIVLGPQFCPPDKGLLIPKTEDGRVLFLLPWLGHTLAGTTDNPAKIETDPKATSQEIDYILRHLKKYFAVSLSPSDVLSSWSGLRPLVSNPDAGDTAHLSRDHVIQTSSSGLITIAGGKWTTYRKMALDTVNWAIQRMSLNPSSESQTEKIPLVGAQGYHDQLYKTLMNQFGFEEDIARHLQTAYGALALQVAQLSQKGYATRLCEGHPYIEAEVLYAFDEEMAQNADDILARRTRLLFLDQKAAHKAKERIDVLLAQREAPLTIPTAKLTVSQ